MRKIFGCSCALTVALALTNIHPAHADTVYSNLGVWASGGHNYFGELDGGTNGPLPGQPVISTAIGQTFVAPAGGALTSFGFELAPTHGYYDLPLTPFVYAWSGPTVPIGNGDIARAIGPNLITGNPLVYYACPGCDSGAPLGTPVFSSSGAAFTLVTANVGAIMGGLTLTPGQKYVFGFTTTNPNGNPLYAANGAVVGDTINANGGLGGSAAVPNLGDVYSSLTSQDWWNYQDVVTGTGYLEPIKPAVIIGDLAYSATFGTPYRKLTLAGDISTLSNDLHYKDLVYYLSDGTHTYTGESLLSGNCGANTTCAFSDTLYLDLGFTPTIIDYTILGFYGDAGPLCGIYAPYPYCTVTTPDVFALTNSSFQAGSTFSTFWGGDLGLGSNGLEDAIAVALYNDQTLASQSGNLLSLIANSEFASSTYGAPLQGQVADFSNGILNGSFDLTANVSADAPEPATTGILAGLLLLPMALRRRRSGKRPA